MRTRTRRLPLAALSLALATAGLAGTATPAQARPDAPVPGPAAPTGGGTGSVHAITDRLAATVADALDRPDQHRLISAALAGPVDLLTVGTGTPLATAVQEVNQAVLAAKGLPADGGSVLRLRLAHPDMRAALERGVTPLVAASPTDDAASTVIGYEPSGRVTALSLTEVPRRPVLVVEVDVAKALPLGLEVMRAALAAQGVDRATAADRAKADRAKADRPAAVPGADAVGANVAGYWATKVTAVRLDDDKEPWIKGAAEIYSVVAGFGLDGTPKVDLVQMPYLDHDGETYYPNQILVHYSAYKYNLADVVMMEDDGDTNYQDLVRAIAAALLSIVDGGVYAPLVDAILAAIPTSWWTDDPDYVDSWYTLATSSGGRLHGASGNGWLDVVPHFVEEL